MQFSYIAIAHQSSPSRHTNADCNLSTKTEINSLVYIFNGI